jgi:hypothetical protein
MAKPMKKIPIIMFKTTRILPVVVIEASPSSIPKNAEIHLTHLIPGVIGRAGPSVGL